MSDFYMAGSHTGNDYLIGRVGTMTLTVLEVMPDGNTLRCGVKVTDTNTIDQFYSAESINPLGANVDTSNAPSSSKITGTYRDPYKIPPAQLEVFATINRSTIYGPRTVTDTTMIGGPVTTVPGHPLYNVVDPMATYQVGDQVYVVEQFHVQNYGRNSAGYAAKDTELLLDFVTNPRPYMERGRPDDEGFDVSHVCLGRWRATALTPAQQPHSTVAGPINSLLGTPGSPGYVGMVDPFASGSTTQQKIN